MAEETVKAKLKDITNNKYVIPIIPGATATEAGVVKVDTALDASSANPVQNKAVKEALDAKQPALTAGDGITIENNVISATASVPDNVWTQENLLAGTNIFFAQVPQPVIDEHTIGLFHFDGNVTNEITNSPYTVSSTWSKKYDTSSTLVPGVHSNFGRAIQSPGGGYDFMNDTFRTFNDGFTVDFWINTQFYNSTQYIQPLKTSASVYYYWHIDGDVIKIEWSTGTFQVVWSGPFPTGWTHLACEKYGEYIYFYINGTRVYKTLDHRTSFSPMGRVTGSSTGVYIDELRISDCARYLGQDFKILDDPYAEGTATVQYQINNTLDISTKQDVIADLADIRTGAEMGLTALQSVPVATTTTIGGVKPDGTTVLVNSEGVLSAVGGGTGGAPTLYWYKHFTTGDTEVETGLDLGSYTLVKVYKNGVLLELSDESGESGAEINDYTIDGTKLIMTHTLHMNDKITLEVY